MRDKEAVSVCQDYKIKLLGYCSKDCNSLLERFVQKGPSGLADLEGEYVIVIENNKECYIVTSPYGVYPYYYTVQQDELFHDDTVIGVLKASRLAWRWNWEALADLTQLDHVLVNDTLHPQVHRVPPRSVLHFKQGALNISSLSWEELHPEFPADQDTALTAFNNAIKRWVDDNAALLLSAGFDSRVILSSLLKYGCRPLIFTMGFDNSTDVVISRQISSILDLNLMVTALDFEDYLKCGSRITALTNGTQTTQHWHAYIHLNKIKLNSNHIFFMGINGEFARSYYLDKGIIARAANMASPLSLEYFWRRSLSSRLLFKKEEQGSLRPEFLNEFTQDCHRRRMHKIINLCHNELLFGLDRFYLEQRVRNFFGNTLKLYTENASWRAPFLNREWVNAAWNLQRNWKFGSNWHRFAIQKNYPQLLNFPEAGKTNNMYPQAPLFYWHPVRKRYTIVNYFKYPEWFQGERVIEFIFENTSLLKELIEADAVISIVKEHKKMANRTRTIAFLLTMIFWLMNLKQAYRE